MFGVARPVIAAAFAIALATFSLVLSATYLGGGTAVIRRQLPRLVLLGVILAGGAVWLPIIMSALGDTAVLVVLLPLSVGLLLARTRRSEIHPLEGPELTAKSRVLATVIVAWITVIVVSTIWLAMVGGGR